jgi:hypothetical protein
MQPRYQRLCEVGVDFLLSLGVNIGGQLLVYGDLATAGRSFTFATLVLGLALPRRYATRHLFDTWLAHGAQQSRLQSWHEVGFDTAIAITVAFLLQWLFYGAAATWAKAGGLTVLVYVVTMGRRYLLRRLFARWEAPSRPHTETQGDAYTTWSSTSHTSSQHNVWGQYV